MKFLSERSWLVFLLTLSLGVFLHFLYTLLPCPLTALISPVKESLWEHCKLLYFPLLAAALLRGGPLRSARLLLIPPVCALMLGIAWVYHILLGGSALLFDLILYAALMALGYFLPPLLPPGRGQADLSLPALSALLLTGGLLVCFTFFPPDNLLFADLSRTSPR